MEGVAVDLHPLAFCDREGNVHLPIEAAEAVARAFAAAEPETVLMSIADDVEGLKVRGYEPGERFSHDYLREKSPGYALARQRAGPAARAGLASAAARDLLEDTESEEVFGR